MSDTLKSDELFTKEQLQIIDEFRKTVYNVALASHDNLIKLKTIDPTLVIIFELSSIISEIIYSSFKNANKEILKVNRCKNQIELIDVLLNFVDQTMLDNIVPRLIKDGYDKIINHETSNVTLQ